MSIFANKTLMITGGTGSFGNAVLNRFLDTDIKEIRVFSREKLFFGWTGELAKVGGISGLESLVRNVAYMVMIARMVNVVGEQGTYWVANNFIWGWLLLPVLQLGELIKQEVARDENAIRRNSLGYCVLRRMVCGRARSHCRFCIHEGL